MPTASLFANPRSISPGDSFDINWFVCPDAGAPTPSPQIVTLFFNSPFNSMIPIPLRPGEPGQSSAYAALAGTIRLTPERLRAAGIQLQDFFRVRTNPTFLLQARADGVTLRASGSVAIVAAFPPPALSFVGPAVAAIPSHYPGDVRAASWNQPYTIVVQIRNLASSTINYTLTLEEAENTHEPPPTSAVTNMLMGPLTAIEPRTVPPLGPGETQVISFTPIIKNWVWLTSGAWIVTGPQVKGFTYDLVFTGRDEFTNPLTPMNSLAQIRVEVAVSAQKTEFVMSAQGLSILAAVLAVAGAVWPPALVAANAAYQGANSFGRSALDPPTPDPNYYDEVKVELPKVANYLEQTSPFGKWLQAMLKFAATREGLYLVEAKILGAHAASNLEAASKQVDSYANRLQEMSQHYQTMVSNISGAVNELKKNKLTDAMVVKHLGETQQKALSGNLAMGNEAYYVEKEEIDLSHLDKLVMDLKPEQVNLRKLLQAITLSIGKSLRSVINDSAAQYADIHPEYFGGRKQKQ